MAKPSDVLQDLLLARALDLSRFTTGLVTRFIALLDAAEADMVLSGIETGPLAFSTTAKVDRLGEQIRAMQDLRSQAYRQAYRQLRDQLVEFAVVEGDFTLGALEKALPDVTFVKPAGLRAIVMEPLRGAYIREWVAKLQRDDARRLRDVIRMGVIEGQTQEQIATRVRGTGPLKFRDGIMQTARREARDLVANASSFVANGARDAVFAANPGPVLGVMWVSALDGSTSLVCGSRDGAVALLPGIRGFPKGHAQLQPPNARPPGHPGRCRSIITAVLAGGAPTRTTFAAFLARQSSAFQDQWLGPTRAALFRAGTPLDAFVDQGVEYTIEQLREFQRVGLV